MLARIDQDVLSRDPGQVFVLGGTNDVIAGTSTDETIGNLRKITERSLDAGAEVFLGTIPPSENLDLRDGTVALNEAIAALGDELVVPVLDFHRALVDEDGTFRDGMNQDDLHPSEAGAKVMADVAVAGLM
jgi:lysophospholipase L1-like esterase